MAARAVARARAEVLGDVQVERSAKEKQLAADRVVALGPSDGGSSETEAEEEEAPRETGAGTEGDDTEAQDEVVMMEQTSDDDESDHSDWLHDMDVDLPDTSSPPPVASAEPQGTSNATITTTSASVSTALPSKPSPAPVVARSPESSPRRGSLTVPRSPTSRLPEPQLSPKKRGQSMFITAAVTSTTLKRAEPSKGSVSTSSHFWVNEQSKRSSRLLDEWKRKEIWHDFKKAEETVLTHPTAVVDGRAIPRVVSTSYCITLGRRLLRQQSSRAKSRRFGEP
ncbi:hypothetical protein PINS_up002381 [Pythium insidiosum]|nr:hypothetical protein PINS_up002381 [Pythium insidiosum]